MNEEKEGMKEEREKSTEEHEEEEMTLFENCLFVGRPFLFCLLDSQLFS